MRKKLKFHLAVSFALLVVEGRKLCLMCDSLFLKLIFQIHGPALGRLRVPPKVFQ